MGILSNLNKNQKKSIILLQIGTFLEYFDLMLYVHMAVFLNDLFFPKTDPMTTKILAAMAFCSSFVLRPIGAVIFGWIGDNFGRQPAVSITMLLMAFSCGVMVFVPTYASIGITATIIVTICRLLQGVASMGEIVGAEIYLTETIRPPAQYPAVAMIAVASVFGTLVALIFASLSSSTDGENWRWAFGIGAGIAVAGSVARTFLRETPDFIQMQQTLKQRIEARRVKETHEENVHPIQESNKAARMLFLAQCAWPICFYFVYMHCGNILKESCHYTSGQVIQQNLIVSVVQLISLYIIARLSYYINPLKILIVKLILFSIFAIFAPYILYSMPSPFVIFCVQALAIIFNPDIMPAVPIFFKYLAVEKRFTKATLTYALSRALMYLVTSFGIIALTALLGPLGIWVVLITSALTFGFGIRHFIHLEQFSWKNSMFKM